MSPRNDCPSCSVLYDCGKEVRAYMATLIGKCLVPAGIITAEDLDLLLELQQPTPRDPNSELSEDQYLS